MKNRILNYLMVFVLVLSVAGCEKRLDIEPRQTVDESKALLTSSDVQAALVGAHALAGDGDVLGGNAYVNAELLGAFNEINWSGTFQGMTQIYNKVIPVNNAFITNTWTNSYAAINTLNNVLSAIDKVEDGERDRVEASAKFLRALLYFNLVKWYGKDWNNGDPNTNLGVPLVTEPTRVINEQSQLPRSTVAEVYGFVITELLDAKSKTEWMGPSALLARVYLQQGNNQGAATEANNVIASGQYSLTNTYMESFPPIYPPKSRESTSEEIFSIEVNETTGINDFNTYMSSNGRGDIDITDDHLDLYDPADDRLNMFYNDGGSIYTGKHENQYSDVTIIRLAEMYLIRAEANFRLGGAPIGGITPAQDINRIRARVNLGPIAEADLTLEDILLERKLELAFEGFAIDDAKRLKQNVGSVEWNSARLVYPIPERETLVNKNLQQNEGY